MFISDQVRLGACLKGTPLAIWVTVKNVQQLCQDRAENGSIWIWFSGKKSQHVQYDTMPYEAERGTPWKNNTLLPHAEKISSWTE